jgi:hypothetical protein
MVPFIQCTYYKDIGEFQILYSQDICWWYWCLSTTDFHYSIAVSIIYHPVIHCIKTIVSQRYWGSYLIYIQTGSIPMEAKDNQLGCCVWSRMGSWSNLLGALTHLVHRHQEKSEHNCCTGTIECNLDLVLRFSICEYIHLVSAKWGSGECSTSMGINWLWSLCKSVEAWIGLLACLLV